MVVPQTGFLNTALLSTVSIARQAAFLQLASEFHTFFRKSFSAITVLGAARRNQMACGRPNFVDRTVEIAGRARQGIGMQASHLRSVFCFPPNRGFS